MFMERRPPPPPQRVQQDSPNVIDLHFVTIDNAIFHIVCIFATAAVAVTAFFVFVFHLKNQRMRCCSFCVTQK